MVQPRAPEQSVQRADGLIRKLLEERGSFLRQVTQFDYRVQHALSLSCRAECDPQMPTELWRCAERKAFYDVRLHGDYGPAKLIEECRGTRVEMLVDSTVSLDQ